VVVEKTAKNFRGYFSLPHPVESDDRRFLKKLVRGPVCFRSAMILVSKAGRV